MRRITILLTALLILPTFAYSQSFDPDRENKGFSHLTRSGQLATVQLRPGEKEIEVRLSGVSALNVKQKKDLSVEATYGVGKNRKKLVVQRTDSGRYVIRHEQPVEDLQIHLQSGETRESFQFNLQPN